MFYLQTADAVRYRLMLEITSQTVREYCTRHKCAYLDADAFIADLDFDIRDFLQDKSDIALIGWGPSRRGPEDDWWWLNAGILFINLAHSVGRAIVAEWHRRFSEITDDQLRDAAAWGQIIDDQQLLHEVLQSIPQAQPHVVLDDRILGGRFIRQVLRAEGNLNQRVSELQSEVSRVLGLSEAGAAPAGRVHAELALAEEMFVGALYRVLLLREPDPQGFGHYLKTLRAGASFEELMLAFVSGEEFAGTLEQFLRAYVRPEATPVLQGTAR